MTENEDLNLTCHAKRTDWFVSKNRKSSVVVKIKSKYSILQYCSCQAINLLTTVCLSLIAAHVCLPSLLPRPLFPEGLRGKRDRKQAPGWK